MSPYSTNQAAKKLGITGAALSRYIKAGKVPAPQVVRTGWRDVHSWTDEDIKRLRTLLPKIANGRKTRYKNKQSAIDNQLPAKTRTQSRAAALQKTALHKTKETKKRKKH